MRSQTTKICVALVSFLAFTTGLFAQGQLNFITANGNTAFGQVFFSPSVPLGGPYVGQLYGSLTPNVIGFAAIGSASPFFSNSGYINAGTVSPPGTFGAQTFYYQLRVWDSSVASTFEAASFGFSPVGVSEIASMTLGGLPAEGFPPFPPPNSNGFTSFVLIPEPSTITLAIVGFVSLIFFPRKRG